MAAFKSFILLSVNKCKTRGQLNVDDINKKKYKVPCFFIKYLKSWNSVQKANG